MNKLIKINLNHNDLNILFNILTDEKFINYPDLNEIAQEGLDKEQWMGIKKYAESVSQFIGIKEGDNFASEWDKKSFIENISQHIQ